jgi:hypothetical protein
MKLVGSIPAHATEPLAIRALVWVENEDDLCKGTYIPINSVKQARHN